MDSNKGRRQDRIPWSLGPGSGAGLLNERAQTMNIHEDEVEKRGREGSYNASYAS